MADNYEIDVTLEEIFGTGISSVEQTVESHEPNGVNEVTVTLTNGQTSVFNVRNGDSSGKPTPVATVAEMTDPTEIYLYTGSEEGYVKGNIYCYKNNEWTDVGTYGGMIVDEELNADSENAVANKAITEAINATPQLRIVENGKWVVAVPDHDSSTASVYVPTAVSMGHPDLLQTDTKSSLVDAINEVKADTNALIAAVGSPLVANTAAGMTDQTKIYVYTGSETGYTSGHWYYYDGSAWADGGIYQSTGIDTDKTLTVANQAADGKAVGNEISDLKSAIQQGGSFNAEVKSALDAFTASVLQLTEKVAYIDENGQDYYDDIEDAADALHSAMYPPANLVSISAVYTQSGTVYVTDSLDVLRSDLVVTALFDDETTRTITNYTLSGTLTVGTSVVTVAYGGKTATFNVTVTFAVEWTLEWDYTDGALPSTADWNTTKQGNATASFIAGKGIECRISNGGYTLVPKNYQTTKNGIIEYVVNFEVLGNNTSIRGTLSDSSCIIGYLSKAGVRINGSTYEPIADTEPNLNTDYTVRVERTDTTGKVYLNGTEVWSGSARDLSGTNNIMVSTTAYDTVTTVAYIKSIKLYHEN